MAVNAIAIRNAAYGSILQGKVKAIAVTNYTKDEFNQFEKSITATAMSVPSTHNGGKYGYAGLIKSEESYQLLTKSTSDKFTEHAAPDSTPDIEDDDKPEKIERAKAVFARKNEDFYIQEGCKDGLKDLIIASVPPETLVGLEDENNGMANVTVLEMMEHLAANCTVSDCFDVDELLQTPNEPNETQANDSKLIMQLSKRIETLLMENEDLKKTQAKDSKLIKQLSKKYLETLLMEKKDLRDNNDRLNQRLVDVECSRLCKLKHSFFWF